MDWLPEIIDERITRFMQIKRRSGFYTATVDGVESLARVSLAADFGAKLRHAQRISSPLLDVIPAAGTRLAAISRDGIPERPAWLGQIWDDVHTAAKMTAWLRANLETDPGHVELGATKSVQIKVGSNPGTITGGATGSIDIGNASADVFSALDDIVTQLIKVLTQLNVIGPVAGAAAAHTLAITDLGTLLVQIKLLKP